ncbi:MAG: peptide ABC transporter permease, partial [Chloroflexota bacterium]
MTTLAARQIEIAAPPRWQASLWGDAWRRLIRNRMAVLGGIIVVLLLLVALFADLEIGPFRVSIAPHSPTKQDYAAIFQPPGGKYILGTDNLGRDQLSRLIYGARVAVAVGIFTQLVILAIGVP